MLASKSGYGITVNLSGSLLLQLKQIPEASDFFDLIKKLLADDKIELLNNAIYHPIIPLTPPDVVKRQIVKNGQLLEELFGPQSFAGFFPTELAVDAASLELFNSQYTFIDQSAVDVKTSIVKYNGQYLLVNNHPVCDLLRSYPRELTADIAVDLADKNCDDGQLLVVGSDAELFGHHYVERLQVLADLLDYKDIKFITARAAVAKFGPKAVDITTIHPSTWQNCQKFMLWDKNDLQKEYLRLLDLAHHLSDSDLLDQSYSSCYLYWLSNWPWWHPGFVEKGVANIIKSVEGNKTIENSARHFLDNMWQYHRSGEVEKKYQEYSKQLLNK